MPASLASAPQDVAPRRGALILQVCLANRGEVACPAAMDDSPHCSRFAHGSPRTVRARFAHGSQTVCGARAASCIPSITRVVTPARKARARPRTLPPSRETTPSRAAIQEALRLTRAKPRSTSERIIWLRWSCQRLRSAAIVAFIVNGGQPRIRRATLSHRSATSAQIPRRAFTSGLGFCALKMPQGALPDVWGVLPVFRSR